jgi:hypothetical protein
VRSFLARLAHNACSRRRTLTLLRGAQASFLAHGLLLTVPAASNLLTVLNGPGLNTVPITGRIVDQIRSGVAHPVVAAAVAAALFTGVAPEAMLHGELTADVAAIRDVETPESASAFSRRDDGTQDGDRRNLPCPGGAADGPDRWSTPRTCRRMVRHVRNARHPAGADKRGGG